MLSVLVLCTAKKKKKDICFQPFHSALIVLKERVSAHIDLKHIQCLSSIQDGRSIVEEFWALGRGPSGIQIASPVLQDPHQRSMGSWREDQLVREKMGHSRETPGYSQC